MTSPNPADTPTLSDLIANAAEHLTPAELRLATTLSDDPMTVAFSTVAEVAERAGVSGPSVIRFSTKLGFDGFGELRDHVRRSLTDQLGRASQRIRNVGETSSWEARHARAAAAVATLPETVPPVFLDAAADAVATARRVWIVTGGHTRPAGMALAHSLRMIRGEVLLAEPTSFDATVAFVDATDDDVAVAIEFRRYEQVAIDAAAALVERGVRLIAITDGPLSPLAAPAELWCELAPHAVGPTDSLLPAVAFGEMVSAGVAQRLRNSTIARLDEVEAGWEASQVFGTAKTDR